jgi:hypothetical protein
MLTGNGFYLQYASQRLLKRLIKLGLYKSESRLESRGNDIFGYLSEFDSEGAGWSVIFHQKLLLYIKTWGNFYGIASDG